MKVVPAREPPISTAVRAIRAALLAAVAMQTACPRRCTLWIHRTIRATSAGSMGWRCTGPGPNRETVETIARVIRP